MKITLENILNEAKTEEQKKMALAKIQKVIRKQWLTARIYGLVYFVNIFFLLTSCVTLFFDEEDKADWEMLPGIITKILNICNKWILSIPEWAVFDIINGKTEALPIWVIYLIGIVVVMIAVPSIIILIVKATLTVFISRDENRSLNGTLPECCKKTYKLAARYWRLPHDEYELARWENGIFCIISALLFIGAWVYEEFSSGSNPNIDSTISTIFEVAVLFGLLWLVLTLLSLIPSAITACGKIMVYHSDLEKLEKFWAEVDPAKKAELERQRERSRELERRKDAELQKRMEEQAQRPQVPISWITEKPVEYKPERSFTDGGPTGCGIGGSFCGCGAGR